MKYKVDELISMVKKARAGNKEALVDLVMQRKDQLYRIAWSYFQNEHDVCDVLQETIVKAFHDIVALKQPEYFYTWYIRILINSCKQNINRKSKVVNLDGAKTIAVSSNGNDDSIDLAKGMAQLSQEYREIIYMRYMEDLPVKDIAKILEIPEGTVKSRIHYGIGRLREYVGERQVIKYGM